MKKWIEGIWKEGFLYPKNARGVEIARDTADKLKKAGHSDVADEIGVSADKVEGEIAERDASFERLRSEPRGQSES